MWRRMFIGGLVGMAAFSFAAGAQTPNRVYRLAHISNSADSETFTRQITLPELARLGFVEGRNLLFDARVGEPTANPSLMRELLAGQPDAVVAIGPALAATAASTGSVPVVAFGSDPIAMGLASSYARPGGNVTGVVILTTELEAKRLATLLEAVPDKRRVALLIPRNESREREVIAIRQAAAALGADLLVFSVGGPSDYQSAFVEMRAQGAQALLIGATPQFLRDARELAGLALEAKLPTVCEWAEMAQAGCLIGYGPNRTALRKRIADQIAKIFRGAKPGDIPIEQPTIFEFALNLKVAKSLALMLPPMLQARADEVIE